MSKENKQTAPVRWEPFMNDMLLFKKSLDYQFDNFFSGYPFIKNVPSLLGKQLRSWKPEIDLYETGKDVIVEANIPGCDKKDIKINVDNNMLTISGEKKEEKEVKKKNFYHKEHRMGSFYRSVGLPSYSDVSKPKANYEKGVLKIVFPKTALAHIKSKKIEISGK